MKYFRYPHILFCSFAFLSEAIAQSSDSISRVSSVTAEELSIAPENSVTMCLAPDSVQQVIGRLLTLRVSVTNDGQDATSMLKPPLGRAIGFKRPVSIIVVDSEGTVRGDLLLRNQESITAVSVNNWVTVPARECVSIDFSFCVGSFPAGGSRDLTPGKYFLEARVHQGLLSLPPSDLSDIATGRLSAALQQTSPLTWHFGPPRVIRVMDDLTQSVRKRSELTSAQFFASFPGPEICRSNRVELEILPRTGD